MFAAMLGVGPLVCWSTKAHESYWGLAFGGCILGLLMGVLAFFTPYWDRRIAFVAIVANLLAIIVPVAVFLVSR